MDRGWRDGAGLARRPANRVGVAMVVLSLVAALLTVGSAGSAGAQGEPDAGGDRPLGDIVFVVDESQSMGGDIADVRGRIGDVMAQLDDADVDFHLGLVGYSAGNRVYSPLTGDRVAFEASLGLLAGNRGNPEAGFSATVKAMGDELAHREGAATCEVLITDEDADVTPAFPETKRDALDALAARDAVVFPVVTTSGSSEFDYGPQPASLAAETGGTTFDLGEFRQDAGPVLEALTADCIEAIVSSQPLEVDAGEAVSVPEGSVVSLAGSATSSVQGIEDRGRFTVPARSDIFAAGAAAPVRPGGVMPVEVGGMAAGTEVTFGGATGETFIQSGCTGTAFPPDGASTDTNVGAAGGVSGIRADGRQMLVGVFVGDSQPSPPAPIQLDFRDEAALFTALSPEVGQTFFVGDGLSPEGVRQRFKVPAGATRLFLGLAHTNYTSFCGAYEIDVSTSTGPAPITYRWEQIAGSGPPVQLSSTAAADPSFSVFDDGTYQFRLTATDGVETISDDVSVTVTNEVPAVAQVASDAAATDGLVEVTAAYSDPGPFDAHDLVIDWGDGTPEETVAAQAGGTGWGFAYAGHRYATLGEQRVVVRVRDDDGGLSEPSEVVVDVGGAGDGEALPVAPAAPSALFAASTTDPNAIRVSGSNNGVEGTTHSNAGIRVSGSQHHFVGGTTYGSTLNVSGSAHVFDPAAVQSAPTAPPVPFVAGDYQPGGRAALAAGANYHEIPASECSGGKYRPDDPLAPGLYLVPCGVQISGADVAGAVSIVATGDIKISGSGHTFVPFIDGLLFMSMSTTARAVDLSGAHHDFTGAAYTPDGGLEVSGSHHDLDCGIVAQSVRISGSDNHIAGVDCSGGGPGEPPTGTSVSIAAPPVIVPHLGATLQASATSALPGTQIDYDVTLTNGLADPAESGAATLLVPALVGVDNHDTTPATVGTVIYRFEVHDPATDEWVTWASTAPDAPPEQAIATFGGRPTPTVGVAYEPADGFEGTVVDPGALGSWASAAVIDLSGDQVAALLDPTRVDAVRNTVTIDVDRPQVRKLARFDDQPLDAITALPALDVADNEIIVGRPAGPPAIFDPATTTALALLTPGASAAVETSATVAVPEVRADAETNDAYLTRLAALDGQALYATAYGTGTAGVGGLYADQQLAATTVSVPVIYAALDVPSQVAAGTDVPVTLTLTNTGTATATDIETLVEVAGVGALTLTGVPAALAPGETATATATLATTAAATTTHHVTATVVWSHPGGPPAAYGPLRPTATVTAAPPVALEAIKHADPDTLADGIGYVLAVTNTGNNPLTALVIDDPIDPNAVIDPTSVTTTAGTVTSGTDPADRNVTVDVGTLEPGATVTVTFAVDYALAEPDTTEIVNQATITTTELGAVLSDDPTRPGTADPNITPVDPPAAGDPGGPGGGGPGGANNGPTLEGCDPTDGATITAPVAFTCTLTPPDATNVTDWTASVVPVGGTAEEAIPVGSGTGPIVSGEIDPTVLANGIWDLTIVAHDTNDGRSRLTSSVVVDGNLKLGRYAVTYQDLAVPVAGIPIQINRTYDTLNANRQGDFGYGWDLEIANFKVQANRPIGQGGWEQYDCGVAVFIVTTCLATNTPHYVTVTWPDGRTETFDATPNGSPPIFSFYSPMAYTPRPGVTSKLLPAPGDEAAMILNQNNGNSNLYRPLTSTLYSPTRYTLQAKDGTRYLLDTTSGLVEAEDRNGNTVTIDNLGIHSSYGPDIEFTRDGNDRITAAAGPGGVEVRYDYDPAGDLVHVDSGAAQSVYQYESHALTGVDDEGRSPFSTLRYEDGRLVEVTDATGISTLIEVDVTARTELVIAPTGRLTTLSTLDDRGNVIRRDEVFDGSTRTRSWEFDEQDRLVSAVDPLGHATTYAYGTRGDLAAITDAKGNTWTIDYSDFGEVERILAPDSSVHFQATHDSQGRATTYATGFNAATVSYSGNDASVEQASGRTIDLAAGTDGLVELASDGAGLVALTSDVSGGRISLSNAMGTAFLYSYDDAGNLISFFDGVGTWSRTYGPGDRVQTVTDPLGRSRTNTYDAAGRQLSSTDRNGDMISFEYNSAGQLTATELAGGERIERTYDGLGRLVAIQDGDVRMEADLDLLDRPVSVTTRGIGSSGADIPTSVIGYTYDTVGLTTSVSSVAGTVTYRYDSSYRLTGVTDVDGQDFEVDFDPAGRMESLSRPNGVTTTATWTDDGRIDRLEHRDGATVVDFVDYDYDELTGRVESRTDPAGTHSYSYDLAGRLTGADHPAAQPDENFGYDSRGNRIGDGQVYDAANRLQSDAERTYAYDLEGRLVSVTEISSGDVTSYEWNPIGQLEAVQGPGGSRTEYRYDPVGRRVAIDGPERDIRIAYTADGNMITQSDLNGQVQLAVTSLLALDAPLSVHSGDGPLYLMQDAIGSITAATDASGTVEETYAYGVFGQPMQGVSEAGNPFSYAGREWDPESATYNLRARQLDPGLGRFISEDLVASPNSYLYGYNDPLSHVDPSGMFEIPAYSAAVDRSLRYGTAAFMALNLGSDVFNNGSDVSAWLNTGVRLAGMFANSQAISAVTASTCGAAWAVGSTPIPASGPACFMVAGAVTGAFMSTMFGTLGTALLEPEELDWYDPFIDLLGGAAGGAAGGTSYGAFDTGLLGAFFQGARNGPEQWEALGRFVSRNFWS